jgi:hypothetical protein
MTSSVATAAYVVLSHASAVRTYRATWELLPRATDRALLLVPEPIVWRLMHSRRERTPAASIQELLGRAPGVSSSAEA